ncbi:hypothetical protein P5E97_14935, partial [Clostridium perfringens]|nr:hypothetical protein [Clostridium perfringens]
MAMEVTAVNGSRITQKIFPNPTIIFVPSHAEFEEDSWRDVVTSANRIRRNLKDFTEEDMLSIRTAFKRMT